MASITLSVNPKTLDLKIGETAVLNIQTEESNILNVNIEDNSNIITLSNNSNKYTVKAVKPGIATIKVKVTEGTSKLSDSPEEEEDDASEPSTLEETVTINVKENVHNHPDERWTDEQVKTALANSKDFEEKFEEIIDNAETNYESFISVLYAYNKNTSILNAVNNDPEYIARCSLNLYRVLLANLEKTIAEENETRFENYVEIISQFCTEFKDDSLSYNGLTRYIKYWQYNNIALDVKNGEYETYLALVKVLATLADPDTRSANLATIDFEELFSNPKVLLSDGLKENLEEFYN